MKLSLKIYEEEILLQKSICLGVSWDNGTRANYHWHNGVSTIEKITLSHAETLIRIHFQKSWHSSTGTYPGLRGLKLSSCISTVKP